MKPKRKESNYRNRDIVKTKPKRKRCSYCGKNMHPTKYGEYFCNSVECIGERISILSKMKKQAEKDYSDKS